MNPLTEAMITWALAVDAEVQDLDLDHLPAAAMSLLREDLDGIADECDITAPFLRVLVERAAHEIAWRDVEAAIEQDRQRRNKLA